MIAAHELEPLLDKVTAAARPNVAFGPPAEAHGYTVITASEVTAGGGFGFGSGTGPAEGVKEAPGGSGGGGGGGSMARPVATIVIGPDGVKVRPVIDVTKLAIAGITAWGAMAMALSKMRR